MNVKEFCSLVGADIGMSRDKVQRVFRAIFNRSSIILQEGDEFRIPAFGKIYCVHEPAKIHIDRFAAGRGEEVLHELPERKRLKFEPYDSLTEFINDSPEDDPPIAGIPPWRS